MNTLRQMASGLAVGTVILLLSVGPGYAPDEQNAQPGSTEPHGEGGDTHTSFGPPDLYPDFSASLAEYLDGYFDAALGEPSDGMEEEIARLEKENEEHREAIRVHRAKIAERERKIKENEEKNERDQKRIDELTEEQETTGVDNSTGIAILQAQIDKRNRKNRRYKNEIHNREADIETREAKIKENEEKIAELEELSGTERADAAFGNGPGGHKTGQVRSDASRIFADGFESGDASPWSRPCGGLCGHR